VDGFAMKLTEGDAPPNKKSKSDPPEFFVGDLRLGGARFTYERKHAGQRGHLRFTDIDLTTGAIGTDDKAKFEATPVKLTARMEGGGRVAIDLNARFFRPEPELKLRLEVTKHDLKGSNAYFLPIDELRLRGELSEARAEVRGGGAKLTTSLALRFRGFDVDFKPGRERSGFSAFLGDLLAGAIFKKDTGAAFHPGYSAITRLPEESPVAFVLRGLKEATLEAARQK